MSHVKKKWNVWTSTKGQHDPQCLKQGAHKEFQDKRPQLEMKLCLAVLGDIYTREGGLGGLGSALLERGGGANVREVGRVRLGEGARASGGRDCLEGGPLLVKEARVYQKKISFHNKTNSTKVLSLQ